MKLEDLAMWHLAVAAALSRALLSLALVVHEHALQRHRYWTATREKQELGIVIKGARLLGQTSLKLMRASYIAVVLLCSVGEGVSIAVLLLGGVMLHPILLPIGSMCDMTANWLMLRAPWPRGRPSLGAVVAVASALLATIVSSPAPAMSDRQLFLLLDQPFALNIVLSLVAVVVLAEIGLLVAQHPTYSLSVARALQASAAGTLSLLFSATFCSLAMYNENTLQQLPFLSSLAMQLLASATVCSWGQGALLRSAVRRGHRQRVMQMFASSSSLFSGGALLAYVTADLQSLDGPPHIRLSTWRVWGYMVAVMGAMLSSWLLHSRRAVLPLGPVRVRTGMCGAGANSEQEPFLPSTCARSSQSALFDISHPLPPSAWRARMADGSALDSSADCRTHDWRPGKWTKSVRLEEALHADNSVWSYVGRVRDVHVQREEENMKTLAAGSRDQMVPNRTGRGMTRDITLAQSWSTLSICQAITFVSSSWFLVRLFMNEHEARCVDQRTGHCSTPIDETFLLVVGCIPFYLLPKILFELCRSRKRLESIQSTAEAVKQEFFVHKMDDVLEEQRLKALPEAIWPKQANSTLDSNGRHTYAGGALHGNEKSPAECVPSQRHNRHLRQHQTRALGMNTQAQDNQLWA